MDQYYVEAAGYSPMERIMEENSRGFQTSRKHLTATCRRSAHPPRTPWHWDCECRDAGANTSCRTSEHIEETIISDAVDIVRKRKNDPLKDVIE